MVVAAGGRFVEAFVGQQVFFLFVGGLALVLVAVAHEQRVVHLLVVETGQDVVLTYDVQETAVVFHFHIAPVVVVAHDEVDDHFLVGKFACRRADVFHAEHIFWPYLVYLIHVHHAFVDGEGDALVGQALHLAADAVHVQLWNHQVVQ